MTEVTSVCEQCRWVWVLDENHQLIGWIDRASLSKATSVSDAVVRGDKNEIAVMNNTTLREALSRMLGQGLKNIPVVDDKGHLAGEVTLGDIEAATAEIET